MILPKETTMIEKLARVAIEARRGEDFSPSRFHVRPEEQVIRAILTALREPTPEMIAHVVQQVGNPEPHQWEIAERAVMGICGPNMQGEAVAAELVRDWQAMINHALNEGEG